MHIFIHSAFANDVSEELTMVDIVEVKTKKQLKIFANFNAQMYKDVEAAVPDYIPDEITYFNRNKYNPMHTFSDFKLFLAYKDGKCVGRIAGIINHAVNEKFGTKQIRMSRIDFIDDEEVSSALFKAVEDYGRENGMTQIHGPLGFCDQDQEGMLIEGFDQPGPFFTIYNAPYYKDHLERLGYRKEVDWKEYKIYVPEKRDEKMHQLAEAVIKRYKLRVFEPTKKSQLKKIFNELFTLIDETYSKLFATVPYTQEMFDYYRSFIILANPKLCKFIYDENDKMVGLGIVLPSMNEALKKHNGNIFPFGWFKFLTTQYRHCDTIDMYFVGVVPEYLNKGLTAVLLDRMIATLIERGVKYGQTGPELEENVQVQALWKTLKYDQHKKRRCWIKEL